MLGFISAAEILAAPLTFFVQDTRLNDGRQSVHGKQACFKLPLVLASRTSFQQGRWTKAHGTTIRMKKLYAFTRALFGSCWRISPPAAGGEPLIHLLWINGQPEPSDDMGPFPFVIFLVRPLRFLDLLGEWTGILFIISLLSFATLSEQVIREYPPSNLFESRVPSRMCARQLLGLTSTSFSCIFTVFPGVRYSGMRM